MEYRPELEIAADPDVYPPSEDSLLLIGAFKVRHGERVLEIGCGSGVVSLHCALNGAQVVCGDINPKAVALTKKNAAAVGVRLDVRETDLFSAVPERFDTIVFNLPYLPVAEEGALARAWSGGPDGLGPLPALMVQAPDHLLPHGRVVIVVSSLMDPVRTQAVLTGRPVRTLAELPLFFEKLRVLEIGF
ncbi:MAG: HemK2/MTQ2 family protein methyltransferase [Methanomethylophilus sp.]|nr:methyltransferase [Methanomethylophilus sp.]MDD4221989.1 methyltransferase [Methanomethylophilus sp.]MDD4668223.1 methyltransferase [Methanomethylophilus sp.]